MSSISAAMMRDPAEQRLQFCVIVIALAHLLIIFGITVGSPLDFIKNHIPSRLEITLATRPSSVAPEKASMAAQHYQLSGSPKDSESTPKTVHQAVFPDPSIQEVWQPVQPEARTGEPTEENPLVTSIHSDKKTQDTVITTEDANSNMMSSKQISASQRMASLMAELAEQRHDYAKLPRKRTVTASTYAKDDAEYLFQWKTRVEQIGNSHYPSEAKHQQLQGDVIMMVAINTDGSLREIQIQKSSGSKILDDAALRIVKLAAPFRALPPEISKTTDVLEIIRTWRFSADQRWMAGE